MPIKKFSVTGLPIGQYALNTHLSNATLCILFGWKNICIVCLFQKSNIDFNKIKENINGGFMFMKKYKIINFCTTKSAYFGQISFFETNFQKNLPTCCPGIAHPYVSTYFTSVCIPFNQYIMNRLNAFSIN